MRHFVLLATTLLVAAGCRGTSVNYLVPERFTAHDNRVCVIAGTFGPEVPVKEIANVSVQLNTYGGDRRAKAGLAKAARNIGAHAVIKTSFTNTMGAPEGAGVAAVFMTPQQTPPASCEWY